MTNGVAEIIMIVTQMIGISGTLVRIAAYSKDTL